MKHWHCFATDREYYQAVPCDEPAVVLYELPDGSRRGFCRHHLTAQIRGQAQERGWLPLGEAAAA